MSEALQCGPEGIFLVAEMDIFGIKHKDKGESSHNECQILANIQTKEPFP